MLPLHLHSPYFKNSLNENKKVIFPIKPNKIAEGPSLKPKPKLIKQEKGAAVRAENMFAINANKENINIKGKMANKYENLATMTQDKENIIINESPRHKPRHLKVHRSSMMMIEEPIGLKVQSNGVTKKDEVSLKSFLREIMPQKNPTLFFNKFIQQVKIEESPHEFLQEQISLNRVKLDINEEYHSLYGEEIHKMMHENELDYSDMLKNTKITDFLRAKMVDWMLEIFAKYPGISSYDTYFKAVSIFHLFIKKCFQATNYSLNDSDIHLTGIACMFLASKYEDECHIQLKDFVNLIGHSAFSMNDIKQREWDIYSILNFNLTFPTSYSFLNFYFYRCFGKETSTIASNVYEISLYVLKLTHYHYSLVEFPPHILAICSIFYAIKLLFNCLNEEICCNLQEIEKKMIDKIFLFYENISMNAVKSCLEKIKWLFLNWETLFPREMNIQKPDYEIGF